MSYLIRFHTECVIHQNINMIFVHISNIVWKYRFYETYRNIVKYDRV